jgi:flavin reductase (DIM6/NTAB) family NADH-FMN oxidoreductase RutF
MDSLLREDFLAGMRSAATGVAIVTTKRHGEQVGVTVSAVCDVELGQGRPLVYCDRSYARVALANH